MSGGPLRDVREISRLAYGFMGSKALFAALEAGVFTALADGPLTGPELSAATGVAGNRLSTLLSALAGLGLVVKADGGWANAPAAQRYLVDGAPEAFGDYYRLQIDALIYPMLQHLNAGIAGDTAGLAPGLAGLPPDSVVLLQPNAEFIESFFVGLNHEMGRELLWRGFPTDQRATVFDSFWLENDRQVPPLHSWQGALGSHLAGGAAVTVLVLRGELVRRFPSATVYLHGRDPVTGSPRIGAQAAQDRLLPTFDSLLEPDTRLIGFACGATEVRDRFFVFQEAPQTLRFGRPTLAPGAWEARVAAEDSVSFATRLLQPPVRLYMPASALL